MELEKSNSLNVENMAKEDYIIYLSNCIIDKKMEINKHTNEHKQSSSYRIIKNLNNIFACSAIFSLLSIFIFYVYYILSYIPENNFVITIIKEIIIAGVITKPAIIISFIIFVFSFVGLELTYFTLFENKNKKYKNNFIGRIKNKLKKFCFENLLKKINPLIAEQNDLEDKLYDQFDEEFIKKVHLFYIQNPYEFGSPEHLTLAKNFANIKEYTNAEDYISMLSLYLEDKNLFTNINHNNLFEKL